MLSSVRSTTKIIQDSGIAFGTSGARGLVEQFTDEVCAAFTVAFISAMRTSFPVERIALGMDRRPSSPAMAAACTSAARAMEVEVDDYGVLPTPALALKAMADGIPCIMITGSHIPFDRNGIKFYRPDGEITKADETAILNAEAAMPTLPTPARGKVSETANKAYSQRFTEWFPGEPLKGWRVGLYQHSAAGRDLSAHILSELGADVVVLGRSEDFVPVDTEAVSDEDQAQGRAWANQHQLHALLSTDGDGDRPLLGDETGTWQRGDIVGLLCARALGIDALAVPVSCNTAIEACGAFQLVERTRIGSPYVLDSMAELSKRFVRVAGFEANGGFLLGSNLESDGRQLAALPTRDALLPALTLMVMAAQRGVNLSQLITDLPARYTASDRLKEFATEKSHGLLAEWQVSPELMQQTLGLQSRISAVNSIDGLRATLENGDIVHLRPSGNAPELRCYSESTSPADAATLVKQSLAALAKLN
ncbi:phosphomannomutase [Vreelandella venusta]|uniref:Phosphomannomutase n=1 Tax=Vreelandella venusta TaxID=44935 RepID=A0AAP9ZB80_9GAMM|nr:phosphomannomutase [Halomonas venusta]QRL02181.1 phosphomannomutase [Halomonas venusta]GEK52239.1 phosphomannomutase [Halomonas venusta]